MENSFEPVRMNDALAPHTASLDLEFPIDHGFVTRPPFADPQAVLRRCIDNHASRLALTKEIRRLAAEDDIVEFKL